MALDKDINLGRLCQAMQRARLVLRKPRAERMEMVREFVGQHYQIEGADKVVPVNLIGMYVNIVGRKLVANEPRILLSTFRREAKHITSIMENWGNKEIIKMGLMDTFQRGVTDALFSYGVVKVALADPASAAANAWSLRAGEPFAEPIDPDDFVFDVHARDWKHVTFIGHRMRVPLRVIKKSKIYSRERQQLQPNWDRLYNMEGDERISMIGRTTLAGDTDEFEDHTDLWEVYLPRHRTIITFSDDQLVGATVGGPRDRYYGKALRIQNWLGPDTGPYHILGFGVVPGNVLPKAPLMDLIDLHLTLNRVCRKLMRQAERQKEVGLASQGQTNDADRVIETNDGEFSRVDSPDSIKVVNFGAPNPGNSQFFEQFVQRFSWLAGGLELLGGLSPQSRTASQDEMLNANSSATIADMQAKVISWTTSVIKSLCWYWHHDPMRVMHVTHSLPGLPQIQLQRMLTPFQRQKVSFEDLELMVDPYSLIHQTPQSRLQTLTQIVTQMALPMMPILQQQGVGIDIQQFMRLVAKYANQPDLQDIFTIQEPPGQSGQGAPGQGAAAPPAPAMPQQTTRNYVRRSLGAQSQGAQQNALMNNLAGAQANGAVRGAE